MKQEIMAIVDQINKSRAKIYYQLNQLENITGLSPRTLKYRMAKVKEKYQHAPYLLSKVGRSWKIHHTIVNEFLPIYTRQQTTLDNHRWETLVTWNMRDNYDVDYHTQLISEVKQQIPSANIAYTVEKDSRGANHLHAVIDEVKERVEDVVTSILEKYILKKDYRSQVEKIHNTSSTVSYLRKTNGITII